MRAQNDALLDAQSATAAEQARYQELVDFAPDAYLVTDAAGAIRELNRAALALLNTAAPFAVGKPLAIFFPDDARQSSGVGSVTSRAPGAPTSG